MVSHQYCVKRIKSGPRKHYRFRVHAGNQNIEAKEIHE